MAADSPAPGEMPKPPPKRGRKPDPSTEPNKSRDLQRLYRARRVQQLDDLQARVAFLEKENVELRRRLGEDVDSPVAGPSPSSRLDQSPAASSLAGDSPAAHTPDVDIKPSSLHLAFNNNKPHIPGPEIDLSGVGRPPIGFSKGPQSTASLGNMVGQSPASEVGSPSPWAHQHFNAAQNNLAAFGAPPTAAQQQQQAQVGTPGAGPNAPLATTPAPFSPADTVWGAEMLQAVQAQAFAAASSSSGPSPHNSAQNAHSPHPLLAGLHGHHPFAHFPAHMGYSPAATRQVPSPSASTTYDLPTPHNSAMHPSSPDINHLYPYGAPSAGNTPASSSAYSPWPSSSSTSARLPDGTIVHTPSSLAAASPPTPPQAVRTRPFRPSPPTQELQRLFLQTCCAVSMSDLPPVGLPPPSQMSPYHIFCLVLLRGLELTGKGRTQRLSWTAEEEQKIAAAAANEVEQECCGGLVDCSGPLFEEEPSVQPITQGFVKVAEAWQLLCTLPGNTFTPITLAESFMAAGNQEDQQRAAGGVGEQAGAKKVSWNVRCEKGHGLVLKESALQEVKRDVEERVNGAGAGGGAHSPYAQPQPLRAHSFAGQSSLGLHSQNAAQAQGAGDEYDPKAAAMPWLQQHRT